MLQFILNYVKTIQYQIIYYFLGAFAVIDDLQNRNRNKLGKHNNWNIFKLNLKLIEHYLLFFYLEIVNKRGKIAVVTGGARGIGLEVVKKLVLCEMHVVIGNIIYN